MTILAERPRKQTEIASRNAARAVTDEFLPQLGKAVEQVTGAQWWRLATPNVSVLIDRIDELAQEDEFDEEGPLRPSPHAISVARQLILDAAQWSPTSFTFPLGSVSSDYDGGLLIEWKGLGKTLRLAVRENGSKSDYLYCEEGTRYWVERDVDSESIRAALEKLTSGP